MSERRRWLRLGSCALAVAAFACVGSVTAVTGDPPGAAGPSAAAPGALPARPNLRILPLGSSSTVGTGSWITAGFRGPLEKLLARDRIAYDMVGTQRSGPPWLADRDHEGHAGWTMAQMQPHVADWVARQHPDIVLLQVGSNDLLTGVSAAATAQRLDTVLTTIGANSKAYVILAGVWAPLPAHTFARARYALLAAGVVDRHWAAGQDVVFVDTSTLLGPADLSDGLHPNAAGYHKIAAIWEQAIRAYVDTGGAPRRPGPPARAGADGAP